METGSVTHSTVKILLLVGAAAGVGVSVRLAAWPLVRVDLPDAAPTRAVVKQAPEPPMTESLITRTVAKDAFRVSRHPSAVAYDPLRLAEQTVPLPPRPVLRLTGLVSGSEPAAVLEGLPGDRKSVV